MSALADALRDGVAAGRAVGVVAMAARGGEVLFEGAAGRLCVDDAAPMPVDALFRVFSMTKAVAGVAAAKLIESGALDPEAPVSSILPAFDAMGVHDGFDADGRARTRRPTEPCRIRHLAAHVSGFTLEPWSAEMMRIRKASGAPNNLSGSMRALTAYPMLFEPGSAWSYGVGIDWLGLVIEAVAGESIDRFCAREIFAPLGMIDTGFAPDAAQRARLAAAHRRTAEGFAVIEMEPARDPEYFGMGYALYSTAPDYLRFLRMMLNGGALDGARILGPRAAASLFAPLTGDLSVGRMKSVAPHVSADVAPIGDAPLSHSIAFTVSRADAPGRRRAGSGSWAGILNTHYWVDPAADLCGVVMMQHLPFVDAGAMALYDAFERAAYRLQPLQDERSDRRG